MKDIRSRPVYSIGVVAELFGVHPATIRVWERSGVIRAPHRRRGKRMFPENELRRLQFVQRLAGEGLSLRAMHFYLRLYPCWHSYKCSECVHGTGALSEGKPCSKETALYYQAPSRADLCETCPHRPVELAAVPTSETLPDHVLPSGKSDHTDDIPTSSAHSQPPLMHHVRTREGM